MKDKPAYWNGIYTGIQFQCVELARRYLLANYGLLFDGVNNAYEIFGLRTIQIGSNQHLYWPSHPNKSCHLPPPGSLIIWNPKGHYEQTSCSRWQTPLHTFWFRDSGLEDVSVIILWDAHRLLVRQPLHETYPEQALNHHP